MISDRDRRQLTSEPLAGFERLVTTCRRFGLAAQLAAPSPWRKEAERRLECPLDPVLAALLQRANGGVVWELNLYGIGNPSCELIALNEGKRATRKDLKRLLDFVLFCKLDYRPEYLATIPSLADARDGKQPVAYLDLNEGIKVLPIASNVDRVLDLTARCLESMFARYGSVEDGASEERFPWDFPQEAANDDDFLRLLATGCFDRFISKEPEVIEWMVQVRGGRSRWDLH